ncbi:unnamed protein product [Arabidopsis halleri]
MLYGKKKSLFLALQNVTSDFLEDVNKTVYVPTVVVIESPFPPSEKLGIKTVQRVEEEIVPMKQMKMDWVPYIPFENRYYERILSYINFVHYLQSCSQTYEGRSYFYNPLKALRSTYCSPLNRRLYVNLTGSFTDFRNLSMV